MALFFLTYQALAGSKFDLHVPSGLKVFLEKNIDAIFC